MYVTSMMQIKKKVYILVFFVTRVYLFIYKKKQGRSGKDFEQFGL